MSPAEHTAQLLVLIAAERARQLSFGHDGAADDARPRGHLLAELRDRAMCAHELVTMRATDPAALERAQRKLVQAAALCLAEHARIDRDLARLAAEQAADPFFADLTKEFPA